MSTSEPTWSKQRNDTCEKNSFPGIFLPPSCKRFAGLITRHKNKRHMAYRQTYLNTICAGINITEREGPVFPGGMP